MFSVGFQIFRSGVGCPKCGAVVPPDSSEQNLKIKLGSYNSLSLFLGRDLKQNGSIEVEKMLDRGEHSEVENKKQLWHLLGIF